MIKVFSALLNKIIPPQKRFHRQRTPGTPSIPTRSTSSTITFTGLATYHKIDSTTGFNTLTFTQQADYTKVDNTLITFFPREEMLYWKGLLGQQINTVLLASDGVSLFNGEDPPIVNVSNDDTSLFTGGGVLVAKDVGRYIYFMAPLDLAGDECNFLFAVSGLQYKEHRIRPLEPPIQDNFYADATNNLDTMLTTLGNLPWDQHGYDWKRNSSLTNIYTVNNRSIATLNAGHSNTVGCQIKFTVPDLDGMKVGVVIRMANGDEASGFDCVINTGDGDNLPALQIIKRDGGDTVIASNSLPTGIRNNAVTLCVRAIGSFISLKCYSSFLGPDIRTASSFSDVWQTESLFGVVVHRTDEDETYADFSVTDFSFVPYYEG